MVFPVWALDLVWPLDYPDLGFRFGQDLPVPADLGFRLGRRYLHFPLGSWKLITMLLSVGADLGFRFGQGLSAPADLGFRLGRYSLLARFGAQGLAQSTIRFALLRV